MTHLDALKRFNVCLHSKQHPNRCVRPNGWWGWCLTCTWGYASYRRRDRWCAQIQIGLYYTYGSRTRGSGGIMVWVGWRNGVWLAPGVTSAISTQDRGVQIDLVGCDKIATYANGISSLEQLMEYPHHSTFSSFSNEQQDARSIEHVDKRINQPFNYKAIKLQIDIQAIELGLWYSITRKRAYLENMGLTNNAKYLKDDSKQAYNISDKPISLGTRGKILMSARKHRPTS